MVRLNSTTTQIIIPGRTRREVAEKSNQSNSEKTCMPMPTKIRT